MLSVIIVSCGYRRWIASLRFDKTEYNIDMSSNNRALLDKQIDGQLLRYQLNKPAGDRYARR